MIKALSLLDYELKDKEGNINGSVEVRRRRDKPNIFKIRITSRINESRKDDAIDNFPFIPQVIHHKTKMYAYIVDGVSEKRPLYDGDIDKAFRFLTFQPLYSINTPRVTVHLDVNDTSEFTNPEFQYSIEYYDIEVRPENLPEVLSVSPEGALQINIPDENTNSTVDNRERRKDLRCSICPPNKGENAKRKSKRGKGKPKSKFKRKGK